MIVVERNVARVLARSGEYLEDGGSHSRMSRQMRLAVANVSKTVASNDECLEDGGSQ